MTSMRKPGPGGLVYSTDGGRMCPGCRQPIAACLCGRPARPAGDGVVRISREKQGRGGKTVTAVRGLTLDDAAWPPWQSDCAAPVGPAVP